VSFRVLRRAVALAFALAANAVSFWLLGLRGRVTPFARAQWMGSTARRVLRALGIHCRVHGLPPAHGLVVANHLSYLDIVIISAAMPSAFVSKSEIKSWPYFGWASQAGGTIFIDRRSRASTREAGKQIAERLALPVPVLLFPEGTSSDGSEVLRFHSSLFEPAIAARVPITSAAVRYVLEDGGQERDLCWFDNSLFLPHLWKALGTAGFFAEVTFGEPHVYPDRRTAAHVTHDEVAAMRAGACVAAVPVVMQAD
jgi:lyso-ornithine lipid O-acyltransferase